VRSWTTKLGFSEMDIKEMVLPNSENGLSGMEVAHWSMMPRTVFSTSGFQFIRRIMSLKSGAVNTSYKLDKIR